MNSFVLAVFAVGLLCTDSISATSESCKEDMKAISLLPSYLMQNNKQKYIEICTIMEAFPKKCNLNDELTAKFQLKYRSLCKTEEVLEWLASNDNKLNLASGTGTISPECIQDLIAVSQLPTYMMDKNKPKFVETCHIMKSMIDKCAKDDDEKEEAKQEYIKACESKNVVAWLESSGSSTSGAVPAILVLLLAVAVFV